MQFFALTISVFFILALCGLSQANEEKKKIIMEFIKHKKLCIEDWVKVTPDAKPNCDILVKFLDSYLAGKPDMALYKEKKPEMHKCYDGYKTHKSDNCVKMMEEAKKLHQPASE